MDACLGCVKRWPFQGDREVGMHLDHFQRDMVNELRSADRILALSEIQAQCIDSTLIEEVGSIEILPPGMPFELSSRAVRRNSDKLRIAHWGTLYNEKGLMVLLDALALAAVKVPIELALLGDLPNGDFRTALERRAKGLPVTFHGAYDRSALEELDADLAVFPSYCFETYSLVVDESVMLGLPMVLSDRGAPAERVGMGAVVVPAGDRAALAKTLIRLAGNRGELTRLASGVGRCWHSREEGAALAEKIYLETLAGKIEALPPMNPLDTMERLELYWLTAGMRLLSLAGTDVSEPPEWRKKGGQSPSF
jgi:glycosyltransferase involved in cell wall biosynthesis